MSSATSKVATLIAIDWGTTNRHGFLLDCDGRVLDSREDGLGLTKISGGKFQEAFEVLTASWTESHGTLPTLLSGMVGASTGWTEAKYCSLPTGIGDLAKNLQPVPGCKSIWIVPGVMTHDDSNVPDVIRGEEVQAISVSSPCESQLIVLPGTHSKWLQTKDGKISWFATFMTGDLYAAILDHTVISQLHVVEDISPLHAFTLGVETGYAQKHSLLHLIFGARTKVLFKELDGREVSYYLSGLLIGTEIGSALSTIDERPSEITLIGSKSLCERYCTALKICGIGSNYVEDSKIGASYVGIAEKAGILKVSK